MIGFYFGELPWYLPYFLKTCKHNEWIDFVIVSNKTSREALPINVRFVSETLDSMQARIKATLGVSIDLNVSAYKLCDFRPCFGVLFPEFVKGYEFWGHCDLDLILGDIHSFVYEQLNTFDFISLRHDYISSWFAIYRNIEALNMAYLKSEHHKLIFTDPIYYNFDETNFKFAEFSSGIHYSKVKSNVRSMTHVIKSLSEEGIIRSYFDFHVAEGLTGRLKWNQGQLTYGGKYELALYHLLDFKKIYSYKSYPEKIKNIFRISASKIY